MLIATRLLILRVGNEDVQLPIRIFSPVQEEHSWSCRYEVDWPDGKWTMTAHGIDAIQAIVSALQMIGSELYSSVYHQTGRLVWGSSEHGYGFPVPSGIRDLLKGDDAKYF